MIMLYFILCYFVVLYCIVLYCIVLYCIVFQRQHCKQGRGTEGEIERESPKQTPHSVQGPIQG